MVKGGSPQYPLTAIKTAFTNAAKLNRTVSALEGAEYLGMDEQDVVDVIAGLMTGDFAKSMRSMADPSVMQDVYKPVADGREMYIKFTQDAHGALLLISFKENQP